IEVQVASRLSLEQRDSIAERRLPWVRETGVAGAEVFARTHRAKSVARHRTGTVHRETALDRQRVAADPTADQYPKVELRIGRDTIVPADVEEATGVDSERRGGPGHTAGRREVHPLKCPRAA